jgi:hypothetical protein
MHLSLTFPILPSVVFLPGFQKGRDQGAVLAKKGNLRRTMKNLKNLQNFTKMFSHKF